MREILRRERLERKRLLHLDINTLADLIDLAPRFVSERRSRIAALLSIGKSDAQGFFDLD